MRMAVALAVLLAAFGADAQETPRYQRELHGIKGGDDRVAVDAKEFPWRAMGRLNNGLGGHCSATLIGKRLVLTAAHCLWNHKTRAIIPAQSLTFVAGYDRGSYLKASKVARLHPSPNWPFGAPTTFEQRAHDWALLELDEALGDELGWLPLGTGLQPGHKVTAAGYGKDKAHVPMAHRDCTLTGRQGALLLHDCDAVQGDSGGPVLAWEGGKPSIVAVNVAVIVNDGDRGIAVDVAAFKADAVRLGAGR